VAVAVRLGQVGRTVALARGELAVEVRLKPFAVRLVRQDNPVIQELTLFAQEWSGGDRLIHLTEGVMVEEERGEPVQLAEVELCHRDGARIELAGELDGGKPCEVAVSIADGERLTIEFGIRNNSAESLGSAYVSGGLGTQPDPAGPSVATATSSLAQAGHSFGPATWHPCMFRRRPSCSTSAW